MFGLLYGRRGQGCKRLGHLCFALLCCLSKIDRVDPSWAQEAMTLKADHRKSGSIFMPPLIGTRVINAVSFSRLSLGRLAFRQCHFHVFYFVGHFAVDFHDAVGHTHG